MSTVLLEKALTTALPDCQFKITCQGNHYTITAAGQRFTALSSVAAHKLIYRYIQQFIQDGSVHAVSIKTCTPEAFVSESDE